MVWINNKHETLGSSDDTVEASSMTASVFNMFLFHSLQAGATNAMITYNNNSNSVYATRYSFNGDTSVGQVDQTGFWNYWSGSDSADRFNVGYFCAITGEEKYGMVWGADTRGSTASPQIIETAHKFVPSPDATITSVKVTNTGGGDFADGSNLSCIGDGGTKTSDLVNIQTNSIFEVSDTGKHFIWNSSTSTWTEVA